MFFFDRKDEKVDIYETLERLIDNWENEIVEFKETENDINMLRAECKDLIINIEDLINSIANTPQSIDDEFDNIKADLESITDIHNADQYVHQLQVSLKISNAFLAFGAGCLIFAGVSSIQKNECIEDENALQETYEGNYLYGEESSNPISDNNDTNISNESNNNEVLKLGAFVVGGVSFGIGSGIRLFSYPNAAKKIEEQVTKIKKDNNNLKKYNADLLELYENTECTYTTVQEVYDSLAHLKNSDYNIFTEDEKNRIWALKVWKSVIIGLLQKTVEVCVDET